MWEKFATLISEISGLRNDYQENTNEPEEKSERAQSQSISIFVPNGDTQRINEEINGSSSEG